MLSAGLVENIEKSEIVETTKGSSLTYYPDILSWEITDFCPLKCLHCYLPEKNNIFISKSDIDCILKLIDDYGIYSIQLTGGEALAHPNFEYIVDNLIKKGLNVSISTSGAIFNDRTFFHLEKLKEVIGSIITISLDGSKETHCYIRNNTEIYDRTIKFIDALKTRNIPFQIASVILNQSNEEIEDLVQFVKEKGASVIQISCLFDQGQAKKNSLKSRFEINEFILFLNYLQKKYETENFHIKIPCEITNQKNCGTGYVSIRLRPNLDVTPCPMLEFSLGNLNNDTFENIMNKHGEIFSKLCFPCDKFCEKCDKKLECRGCIAQGLNNKEKVQECNWFEEQKALFRSRLC